MNDIQKARALIIDIEQFLSVGIMPTGVTAASIAGKYCDLCERAFDRINSCVSAIDSGRYTDAIQEAESVPSLLEIVAVLSFNRRDEWLVFLEKEGLPVARNLSEELLHKINEAYSQAKFVAPIERNFRRAMLQRPVDLYGGILALRRLVKAQGKSEEARILRQDLRAFELRRLKWIKSAFETFEKESDLNGASSLLAELMEEWQERETKQRVLDRVKAGIDKLRSEFAAKRAGEVVTEIWDAYGADRFIMVEVYLLQYRKLQDEGYYTPDEDTVHRVKEVSDWYDKEAAIRDKSVEVNNNIEALREYVNAPHISNLKEMRWLRNFVFGVNFDELYNVVMPNDLPPEKVNSVINSLSKRARLRTLFITVGAMATVISILLAGFFVYRSWVVSRQADYYAESLITYEKALNWEQFKKLKDELEGVAFSERIRIYPGVRDALAKGALLEERVRKAIAGFNDRIDLLTRMVEDSYKDDDKFIKEYKMLKKLHTTYPALRNDYRAQQIEGIKNNRQDHLNTLLLGNENRLQSFANDLKMITVECGTNVYVVAKGVDAITNRLSSVVNDAEAVEQSIEKCLERGASSSSLSGTQGLYAARKKKSREVIDTLLLCRKLSENINNAKTANAYHDALSAYVNEFPDCPQSVLFGKPLSRWPVYEDFMCWKGMNLEEASVEALIEKASAIKKSNQFWNPVFANYVAPMKRFQTVAVDIRGDMPDWKKDEYLTQMYLLKQAGRSFLFMGKPKAIKTGVGNNVEYEILMYELKKGNTESKFKKVERPTLPKNLELITHCKYMNELITRIENEVAFCKPENVVSMFQEVRTTDKISIEVLRFILLQYFAGKAVEVYGSETLPELDAFCSKAGKIDTTCKWMCVYNNKVIKLNSKCEQFISEELAELNPLSDVRQFSLMYEKCISRGVCWLGYVSPVSGKVVLNNENRGGEVWVLRDDDSGVSYPVIASTDGKRFDMDLDKGESLFGSGISDGLLTIQVNKDIEKKLGRKLTPDDFPLVWPRLKIANKAEITGL